MATGSENPLAEYGYLFRKHSRRIAVVAAGCTLLALLVAFVLPRKYSAVASFVPQRSELARSGLASIAAQFGVNLPLGDAGESPAFYAQLLQSRTLLRFVVNQRYPVPNTEGDSATLIDLWKVKGKTPGIREEKAIERLSKVLSVRPDNELNLVSFTVRTKDPRLSVTLASHLVDELNRFNVERRQSRASSERAFTEQRAAAAKEELRTAESNLETFLERNRRYSDSPALVASYNRLQRELGFRQQVYTSLAQAHERARIEEVQDTPVITVVESPVEPARPDPRGVLRLTSVGLLFGILLGLCAALVEENFPGWHPLRRTR